MNLGARKFHEKTFKLALFGPIGTFFHEIFIKFARITRCCVAVVDSSGRHRFARHARQERRYKYDFEANSEIFDAILTKIWL
jgi:hypothetical protein